MLLKQKLEEAFQFFLLDSQPLQCLDPKRRVGEPSFNSSYWIPNEKVLQETLDKLELSILLIGFFELLFFKPVVFEAGAFNSSYWIPERCMDAGYLDIYVKTFNSSYWILSLIFD